MAFTLTKADQKIVKGVKITMLDPAPVDNWPGWESKQRYPSPYATEEAKSEPADIPIQFPPKIRGNSKSAIWNLHPFTSYEPVAVFKGADATKLSIELKYVVTGGTWSVARVSAAVHTIMGYFYRTIEAGANGVPLVKLQLYNVAPGNPQISTWRMDDASVQCSDELVIDGNDVYPQISTVTINLAMVTQVGNLMGSPVKQDLQSAPKHPLKEWY